MLVILMLLLCAARDPIGQEGRLHAARTPNGQFETLISIASAALEEYIAPAPAPAFEQYIAARPSSLLEQYY